MLRKKPLFLHIIFIFLIIPLLFTIGCDLEGVESKVIPGSYTTLSGSFTMPAAQPGKKFIVFISLNGTVDNTANDVDNAFGPSIPLEYVVGTCGDDVAVPYSISFKNLIADYALAGSSIYLFAFVYVNSTISPNLGILECTSLTDDGICTSALDTITGWGTLVAGDYRGYYRLGNSGPVTWSGGSKDPINTLLKVGETTTGVNFQVITK